MLVMDGLALIGYILGFNKKRWGSFENEDGIYKDMEALRAYEMALSTWSDWLEVHVNRSKTRLFFVSLSPTHQK